MYFFVLNYSQFHRTGPLEISVPIAGDNQVESDETFAVNISKPYNAILGTGRQFALSTTMILTSPSTDGGCGRQ